MSAIGKSTAGGMRGIPLENDNVNGFALLAHDFKSALFGVIGSLEQVDLSKVSTDAAEQIKRARDSGIMLNDLLNIAFEVDSDSADPDNWSIKDTINLDALVDARKELHLVSQVWINRVKDLGLELNLNIQDDLMLLNTKDRVGFHRIFNNLIGNAVKFTKSGVIEICAKQVRNSVLSIQICDNGPGFSEEALQTIFQYRGRPENNTVPGTGFGLYISKVIVEKIGGTIFVKNMEKGGACIEVSIPVTSNSVAHTKTKPDELPDLSHLKLLLAEDNVTNQLVVTQMLKSMGAKYSLASDGVEALDFFDREDYDLVLLDIEMPRKSGLEVMREIRSRQDSKSGVPLVALTAYVMQEHKTRIDAAGADGIIAKPITGIAELGRAILKHVHGSTGILPETNDFDSQSADVGFVDLAIWETLTDAIGPEMYAEFIDKVTVDLNNVRDSLIDAESTGNIDAIRVNSHTLISVAGAIGATELRQCSSELNTIAKTDASEERKKLSTSCVQGISEVLDFLISRQ